MSKTELLFLVASTLTLGCTSENESETTARLGGSADYRDATTDHEGAERPAATPGAQSARVSVVVEGTGTIPEVDPKCALDPAGQFEAHYLGSATITDTDVYSAALAASDAQIQTPSGCAIPMLTVGVITDVMVRGELAISTTNCDTFCSAQARADAEAQCSASASAATCRAQYEAQASGQCKTTCTTKAHAIVAEVSVAAALLGGLDADALRAGALGDLTANLTFDHLEDPDGNDL